MPKNTAQWTGFAVTLIIVLGRDADVLTAVPLGIAAGMLATLLQQAMRMQLQPVRLFPEPRPSSTQRETTIGLGAEAPAASRGFALCCPVTSMVRAAGFIRPKRRHVQFRE